MEVQGVVQKLVAKKLGKMFFFLLEFRPWFTGGVNALQSKGTVLKKK